MDRNAPYAIIAHDGVASLSARRAWIEIAGEDGGNNCPARRSPQGERG